jgi:hypothetical protein
MQSYQNLKFFGFKNLILNGHLVHTCNISIDRIEEEYLPVIDGVFVSNSSKLLKSGKEKLTTVFSYVTTNHEENKRLIKEIGLVLEKHAQDKLKKRYAWVHNELPTEVPEVEFGGELMF